MSVLLFILFFPSEREWSAKIAREIGGKTEVRTADGSRVDILTTEYAYEVEWADKHWQAPAQAVFYGLAFNRKPAVILLVKDPERDRKYILRCMAVCAKLGIRLETRDAR